MACSATCVCSGSSPRSLRRVSHGSVLAQKGIRACPSALGTRSRVRKVRSQTAPAAAKRASLHAGAQTYAEHRQVGLGNILFDEWKELMLLEAHVRGQ